MSLPGYSNNSPDLVVLVNLGYFLIVPSVIKSIAYYTTGV